jgi:hypothetical protein
MTDARRSTSGLLAVVVLAPAAAGVLAVGTGWALAHPPRDQAVAAGSAVTAADEPQAVDRSDALLHQQALTAQRRVEHLTRALHHLRARAEALRAAPLPGAGSSGFTARPSSGGGGVSVPAPPVASAPRPATHTSTGAS